MEVNPGGALRKWQAMSHAFSQEALRQPCISESSLIKRRFESLKRKLCLDIQEKGNSVEDYVFVETAKQVHSGGYTTMITVSAYWAPRIQRVCAGNGT